MFKLYLDQIGQKLARRDHWRSQHMRGNPVMGAGNVVGADPGIGHRRSFFRFLPGLIPIWLGEGHTDGQKMKDEPRSHPFRDSVEDIAAATRIPDTPQTRAPAYRLAFADRDFLTREELRPVRLQLELLKPQLIMDERGIETTIVMFGGARIHAPEHRDQARTKALADLSHYYDEARRFAKVMTERSLETYGRENVAQIITYGTLGAKAALRDMARVLDIPLREQIISQLDNQGDAKANLALGTQRAQNVLRYFRELGIPPRQMAAFSEGGKYPVSNNNTEVGQRRNRRINFIIE